MSKSSWTSTGTSPASSRLSGCTPAFRDSTYFVVERLASWMAFRSLAWKADTPSLTLPSSWALIAALIDGATASALSALERDAVAASPLT